MGGITSTSPLPRAHCHILLVVSTSIPVVVMRFFYLVGVRAILTVSATRQHYNSCICLMGVDYSAALRDKATIHCNNPFLALNENKNVERLPQCVVK